MQFSNVMIINKGQFIQHRRRSVTDGGREHQVWNKSQTKLLYTITNADVVPYNPALLLRFQCHINVESVVKVIAGVKYLYKYLLKGPDRVVMSIEKLIPLANNEQTE